MSLKIFRTYISDSPGRSPNSIQIVSIYNYSSVLSFVALWLATILQLRVYSARLGKVKYWLLVSAPVVYFLFPFISLGTGISDNIRFYYWEDVRILYTVVFSPYKQVGGFLFGIVFWITASAIKRRKIKEMLRLGGIGMTLLFGSTVIHGLTYIIAPPFGIITLSYMPLASFLILVGIHGTSKEIASDSSIRRELYRTMKKQLSIFRDIGFAETEQRLRQTVTPILKKKFIDDDIPEIEHEEEVQQFIREVMDELHPSKKTDL